jgi:hypothetical protein
VNTSDNGRTRVEFLNLSRDAENGFWSLAATATEDGDCRRCALTLTARLRERCLRQRTQWPALASAGDRNSRRLWDFLGFGSNPAVASAALPRSTVADAEAIAVEPSARAPRAVRSIHAASVSLSLNSFSFR